MTYTHLTTADQLEFVAARVRALEVEHWKSTVMALEADVDMATPDDVAESHRADARSLDARLGVLASLTAQLTHPSEDS